MKNKEQKKTEKQIEYDIRMKLDNYINEHLTELQDNIKRLLSR